MDRRTIAETGQRFCFKEGQTQCSVGNLQTAKYRDANVSKDVQICYFTIKCPLILEGSSSVCVEDIFNALERIGLGLEKKDAVMSEQKRKLVAYHEAGALDHWLVHSRKISFSMVHHWYIQIASHMQRQKHADHIQILMNMMILYTAVVGKTNKQTMHIKSRPLLIFAGQVMQSWVR